MNLTQIIENLPYLNIHAHILKEKVFSQKQLTLLNLDYSEFDKFTEDEFYSAGFHPWNIKLFNETWLLQLEDVATQKNILAIGECGLDRNISIDFEFQKTVFHHQILLANKIKKPLIIHSVRAFYDVVSELKKAKNKMPVIYHGFNNSLKIAETLMNNNGFISFGKSLMQEKNNTSEIIKQIPLNRIFLESDESTYFIETIFTKAASLLNLPEHTLKEQVISNFASVFSINTNG